MNYDVRADNSVHNKMTEYQYELYKVMQEFHAVCEENNLKYFIIGGTLLGAIRHKGFIPWDDDIDVAMPRDDYEKLLKLGKQYFSYPYEIEHFSIEVSKDLAPDFYTRLVNREIDVSIEKGDGFHYEKAFIDIFPIDGTPNSKLVRKFFYLRLLTLRALYKFTVIDEINAGSVGENKRKLAETLLIKIAQKTRIGKLLNGNKLREKVEKLLSRYPLERTKCKCGTFHGRYRTKEFVDKMYFNERQLYKFEDSEFWGTRYYDGYLKEIYGNYMQLPPMGKRISPHRISVITHSKEI